MRNEPKGKEPEARSQGARSRNAKRTLRERSQEPGARIRNEPKTEGLELVTLHADWILKGTVQRN